MTETNVTRSSNGIRKCDKCGQVGPRNSVGEMCGWAPSHADRGKRRPSNTRTIWEEWVIWETLCVLPPAPAAPALHLRNGDHTTVA